MDARSKEVDAQVQKITGLHAAIAKLPSLSPSPDVDALFTDLVTACVPPSPVDVTKLGPEAQEMLGGLIRLAPRPREAGPTPTCWPPTRSTTSACSPTKATTSTSAS
ncbi:hypothetical protein ZWY2020_034108 [Hordeum vulgare]|nr:hypothetical protein ZWY2020_034108 [Hordeum vulgare]